MTSLKFLVELGQTKYATNWQVILCLSSGSPWECTTGVCKCQLSEQSDGWQSSACQVGAVIPFRLSRNNKVFVLFTHLFIINVIEIKFGYLSNSWIQENEELKKTLGSTVERSYMHGRKYIAAKVHTNMLYFIGMSRLVESIKGTCELQSNLMASTLDSVF